MSRMIAGGAAGVAVLFVGAMAFIGLSGGSDGDDHFAQCRSSNVAGDLGGPFELVNAEGQTVTESDVITEPTLECLSTRSKTL